MRTLFLLVAMPLLAGCASIVSGTSQDIQVSTNPPGAECVVRQDGKEIGRINPTPGTVTVGKSRHDLTISCTKPDYYRAEAVDESGTEPWTYGNIAIGIAFFGGFIGHGIDRATGASNHYEEEVTIDLVPQATVTPPAPNPPAPPPNEAPPATP